MPTPFHATHSVVTDWVSNPLYGGVYSFLRPGGTPDDRTRLAEEVLPNLWLAGEYNWADGPGTLHGAIFSGEHAAQRLMSRGTGSSSVVVIGAGLAGLTAAQRLAAQGYSVVVLEASPFIGGRARSDSSMGIAAPLGGAWLHGHQNHPLAAEVQHLRWDNWDTTNTFVLDHGQITETQAARTSQLREAQEDHWNTEQNPQWSVADALRHDSTKATHPLNDIDRQVLDGWMRFEYGNLISAPLHELSVIHREEPYFLAGQNHLITQGLPEALARRAHGLDVRHEHRVTALEQVGSTWRIHLSDGQALAAEQVICATPLPALRDGHIHITPALPGGVRASLQRIGFGRVAKTFFRFAKPVWGDRQSFLITGPTAPAYEFFVDITPATGSPTLCAFSLGDNALLAEQRGHLERVEVLAELLTRARVNHA